MKLDRFSILFCIFLTEKVGKFSGTFWNGYATDYDYRMVKMLKECWLDDKLSHCGMCSDSCNPVINFAIACIFW